MRPRRVLVVIPSFNERAALPAVLADVGAAAAASSHTIEPVVVDDGSADDSSAVARGLGVRVVRLCSNLGIGGAVQTGLRLAWEEGFDCAVQFDGDGQHLAREIDRLLLRLDDDPAPDLVVGSRYLQCVGFQSTVLRRAGKGWLSMILRVFVGLRATDPTSGFRLFGPRALHVFQGTFPYDFPEAEALSMAHLAGLRIVEQPVEMRERQGGASSIQGLLTAYYVLKVTAAILIDVVRGSRHRLVPLPPAQLETRWKTSSAGTGSSSSSASALPSPSSGSSRGSA
jgi:glycosyltransferase involved in cell wall biosynthesis